MTRSRFPTEKRVKSDPSGIRAVSRHSPADQNLFSAWRCVLAKLFSGILFRRIRQYGRHHIPATGPSLFACTHRNGAIDGYVVHMALARPLFILGANLTGSLYTRFFFGGHLDINRNPQTHSDNRKNQQQFAAAAKMAAAGRQVVMFPEGTSWLGPTLRPIRKGMAYLIRQVLKELPELGVVPVALHYERGNEFRSDVELHFGAPLYFAPETTQDLDAMTTTLTNALNDIAVNFASPADQVRGECFAHAAMHLEPELSHRNLCRSFARSGLPQELQRNLESPSTCVRTPILPNGPVITEFLRVLLLTMFVLPALLLNLPTCLGAFLIARRYADDTNVVTLWRLLSGTPIFVLQSLLQAALLAYFCGTRTPLVLAGILGLTWLGLQAYRPWKSGLICLNNWLSGNKTTLATLRNQIRQWLDTSPSHST